MNELLLSHILRLEQKNRSSQRYLVSGLDLCTVVVGDIVCLLFFTVSFVRAFFSFSFSLSLSFFSFFFLSTFKEDTRAADHDHMPDLARSNRLKKLFVLSHMSSAFSWTHMDTH